MLSKLLSLVSIASITLALPQATEAPEITSDLTVGNWTSYRVISATVTKLYTSNASATTTTYQTATQPYGPWHTSNLTPPYDAAVLYAYNPDAPFHLMPFIAEDSMLRLGGADDGAYCPAALNDRLDRRNICEDYYNVTAFYGCYLAADVPGGQNVFMGSDGQMRFNAPHSHAVAPQDVDCPWTFRFLPNTDIVRINFSRKSLNTTGFMACPMLNMSRVADTQQQWQIYGNTPFAKVYYGWEEKDASWCTPFEAFGVAKWFKFNAAWEYF